MSTLTQYQANFLPDDDMIVCQSHQQQACLACGIDWTEHNQLAASLKSVKEIPLPNKPIPSKIKASVNKLKLDGNQAYKLEHFEEAVKWYTSAVELAWSRPLWEPLAFQAVREELAPILSNRSAANLSLGSYVDALVDAHIVTQLKKDWSKGWFRKGKALMGLQRFDEASKSFHTALLYTDANERDGLLEALKECSTATRNA
ncbi:conserved hypothetical protein [Mucor ambiguus]|uniref:Tetratricopeptide repeat protein n=1 Tax=Mucor ambiguus TaxID=91626 RepID=A0A0C9M580_9FUNG|nr:conserved hypothetical protein [Mucor ambiguus]